MSWRYVPEKLKFTKLEKYNNEKAIAKYKLFKRMYEKSNDEYYNEKALDLRNRIVMQNLPLVILTMTEIRHPNEIKEDLVDTGVVALIDSIDKYDSNEEVVFTTYAGKSVKRRMLDEVERFYGDGSKRYGAAIRKYKGIAIKEFGFSSIIYDEDIIDFILDIMEEQDLLETVTREGLKNRLLSQREATDDEIEDVEKEFDQATQDEISFIQKNKEKLFEKLTIKERFTVEYICGFKDGIPHTSQELANIQGISRQSINQQYNNGIKKMQQKVKKIETI